MSANPIDALRRNLRMVLQHVLICGPDETVQRAIRDVDDALAQLEDELQVMEGVKHQRYVAACIRGAMRGDDMAEQAAQVNLRD